MIEAQNTLVSQVDNKSKFREIVARSQNGWRHYLWIFWALLGPGVLAMLADNDGGGVISYAVTGAQYGIGFFVPLVLCLAPLTYTVQEMSLRLGAVTQDGFSRLALKRYGHFWAYYHITTLSFENVLTLVTEFIGMTAGLVMLGLPLSPSVLWCFLLVVTFALFTGYWTKERVALLLGMLNVSFVAVAAMTHPSLRAVGHAFTAWNVPVGDGNGLVFFVLALIGNAVAPWMIFFQGSGSIDKGTTSKELKYSRIDTAIGAVLQVGIAAGIIILGAALYGHIPNIGNAGPADIIDALNRLYGRWPAVLFGLGLFNAGFLASITVSLSSSWSIAELFGWSKSLNDKITEAPKFYAVYIGTILLAAIALLIPKLPLNTIAVMTQVIGGILTAPLLIFLVLMTSDEKLMGEHRTKGFGKLWGWLMAGILVGLAVMTLWQTVIGLGL